MVLLTDGFRVAPLGTRVGSLFELVLVLGLVVTVNLTCGAPVFAIG